MANQNYDAFVKAYNNFDSRPLAGESMRKFYVDDFTKDITHSIIKTVQITEKYRKILIIGHTGCGKSTILNKVAEELKDQYHVVAFSVANELNMMDIETIDILTTIYLQLIYSLKEKEEEKALERILKSLENLAEKITGNSKIQEMGLALLKSISFKIKVDPESREAIRGTFRKQVETIQENISTVCKEIRKKTKKDILIIIDDLDKLKDEDLTEKIFLKEAHMLTVPEARVILTFPLATYYSSVFVHVTDKFSHQFIPLVNLYGMDNDYRESSFELLKKLVLKRIDKELISGEALQSLIDHSGGLLRDLIQFMQDACKIVSDKNLAIIDNEIAQTVIQYKTNEYGRLFDFPRYENEVRKIIDTHNKSAIENTTLVYLLRYLLILEYGRPGEQSWYDAHPCLKRLLRYDEEGLDIPDEWLVDSSRPENEFKRFFIDDLPPGNGLIKGGDSIIDSRAELSIIIEKLRMKNFRGFKDREIVFSDRFNLLLGDNGSGKTAVLDALGLVCSSIVSGLDAGNDAFHIRDEDVYQVSNFYDGEIRMEPNYAVSIEAQASVMGKPVRWSKTRLNQKGQTLSDASELTGITSKFQQPVRQGQHVTLPVMAYYGTGRLWLQTKEYEVDPLPPVSRLYGYKDCLAPRSNERELIRWFKEQELAKNQGKKGLKLYEAVKKAISACIDGCKAIWFDFREDSIMVQLNDGQCLPANLFSDGYRNIIAIAADIAYRMSILNPHLGLDAARKTPGIVLIDEIDLHLHPKWQRRVVDDLKRTFPNVQFVATSHSPFIVQSLKNPAELIDLGGKRMVFENMDQSIEDIAEEIMDVDMPQKSKRYIDMMKVAEKYYKLLEEGKRIEDDDELKKIKRRLDELLIPYSEDPAFQAFLEMERKAAKIDETDS
jgi:predicted ATP-binding protein involved in virulence